MGLLNSYDVEVRAIITVEASSQIAALREVNELDVTYDNEAGMSKRVEIVPLRAVQKTDYR